jgi:hypothetical protein
MTGETSPSIVINLKVEGNVYSEADFLNRVTPKLREALLIASRRNGGRLGLT